MEHRSTEGGNPTQEGVSRRTIITGAAWSIPLIASSVSLPAAAASSPPEGLILPPAVAGMYGGGWSITTVIDEATSYAAGAYGTRATAAYVPVRIIPARAAEVTLTITGAGYAFVPGAGTGAFFVPSLPASRTITVTTDASGNADVYVAIPPYGIGEAKANIVATSTGLSLATSTVRPYPGYVYTVGGHSPEGQTGNGLAISGVRYPTPWPVHEHAEVYGSLSSAMAITASGKVFTCGYNPYAEVATGDTANRLVASEALKDDGDGGTTVFTNAKRGIIGKHGSEEGVFMIEDADGQFWAAGENYANYLQIPDASPGYEKHMKFVKVGGLLPSKPTWASYPRNSQVMLWTLEDGTAWAAGLGTNAYGSGIGFNINPVGVLGLRPLLDKDGAPTTGVKKAVQSNDTAILILKDDGTLWYSTEATPEWARPIDYTDVDHLQQIAPPPGGASIADIWPHQPFDHAAGFFAHMSNGTLWAFGGNEYGIFGNGSITDTRKWVRVGVDNVVQGGSGADSLILLDEAGDAWYSGLNEENASGMAELPWSVPISTPVKISSLPPKISSVAATWWDATLASIDSPGPQG